MSMKKKLTVVVTAVTLVALIAIGATWPGSPIPRRSPMW